MNFISKVFRPKDKETTGLEKDPSLVTRDSQLKLAESLRDSQQETKRSKAHFGYHKMLS